MTSGLFQANQIVPRTGNWQKGPGLEFWKNIMTEFPQLPFLAEDLGDISKGVLNLRKTIGLYNGSSPIRI